MRVDPRNVVGRRAEDVEAAIARMDAVVTTRMHGLVLAVKHGVPAVAVDPVPGGAKVSRQAVSLDWPATISVDDLTAERLVAELTWALSTEARNRARDCAHKACERLASEVRDLLLDRIPASS
jgi:polysaccharide pyruvyl transferase WcaK-like protein